MRPKLITETDRLLNNLNTAIDEARLVRELMSLRQDAQELRLKEPFSQHLRDRLREIRYLQSKLSNLRNKNESNEST